MSRRSLVAASLILVAVFLLETTAIQADVPDEEVRASVGPGRGICVLLGEASAATAVELAQNGGWTVYVQSSDDDRIRAVRADAEAAGLLGVGLFAEQGDGSRIHLADNLADVVVTTASARPKPTRDEVMRVLRPQGRWIDGKEIVVKPVPPGSGQWTHPYHGGDNNPQADDTLAVAPYLTQFLAAPWYGPMPEVTVASGGRVFKAFGHLAFKQREWPLLGKLIAINGYNGTRLWELDLQPGFMIHRNTLIATPDILYLADNQSCKLIDTTTGKQLDEITIPGEPHDGASWKWMALSRGVLYALDGAQEPVHEVVRGQRTQTGWPWTTVRDTYGPHQDSWGRGKTLRAIDPATKEILWTCRESEPIDSRAICMNDNHIFIYSHQNYLAAIDAEDGTTRWRTSDPDLLASLGEHHRAQDPRYGYATTSYAKCNADVILFAGPQRHKLVAVSARDGRLLWTYDDGNLQLVLRENGVYAMGRLTPSRVFDYRTGKVLAELPCFRGNCTRATGAVDSIFARGYRHSGTLRLDLTDPSVAGTPHRLPAMRPACQDGVIVANGLLYWGPWMCDCNHSLIGVVSLAPAGEFDLESKATDGRRLQRLESLEMQLTVDESADRPSDERDWPTYRANNERTSAVPVDIPRNVDLQWEHRPGWQASSDCDDGPAGLPWLSTASIAVGGRVFLGGTDGVVHAVDADTGDTLWKAYTGGAIRYAPTYDEGRLYVGSADGWIYCHAAKTGRRLWRFRAAPVERKIPVYGLLQSTWPVSSGVLVQDGVAYAAAGIACHDGTHVYALDAATGAQKWQNSGSGNLVGRGETVGVSVQGHLLYNANRLYLAGGNVVSPAIYEADSGVCLNELNQEPTSTLDDHWQQQRAPRGSELYLVDGRVVAAGTMLYSPASDGPPSRYHGDAFLQAQANEVVIRASEQGLVRVASSPTPGQQATHMWRNMDFVRVDAIAIANKTILVGGLLRGANDGDAPSPALTALEPSKGHVVWKQPLSSRVTTSGISLDRSGRILTSLANGTVQCWGEAANNTRP